LEDEWPFTSHSIGGVHLHGKPDIMFAHSIIPPATHRPPGKTKRVRAMSREYSSLPPLGHKN